jgi:putative MATE family efflux protein
MRSFEAEAARRQSTIRAPSYIETAVAQASPSPRRPKRALEAGVPAALLPLFRNGRTARGALRQDLGRSGVAVAVGSEQRPAGRPARVRPNLTEGPIGPTLIAFALPMMGSNILQTLNGSINTMWVSHILGEAALTATANGGQIFFLLIGVVFGISMAANLMIGQAIGGGDPGRARRVVGSCTTFFIVASLGLAAVGMAATPAILDGMSTPADARADAIIYLRVMFAAMPFVYFFNFVMMAQRGAGDSRTPFYFAVLQVSLDLVLNPLLIIGVGPFPKLGIAGSASATLISQSLTLAIMLVHLYRRRSLLVIRPSEWRLLLPDLAIVRALVFKGLPMGFQMIVVSLAGVTMMSMINRYGTHTAAAYGAAMQLWSYVQMPAMAISGAVSSMAAQNVGAGRMDRVEKIAWLGAGYAFVATAGPILAILAADHVVLQAFLPASSPALPIAQHINARVIWGFAFFALSYSFSGVVRATGAVWPPLLAIIVAMWGVRVPFAYALQPYWGADAIWVSFPLGSLITLVIALAYYRWGGWRTARLVDAAPHGDVADGGLSPPTGVEETEAQAEALETLRRQGAPQAPGPADYKSVSAE